MARLDTPDVSDDDFAMVNSATFDSPPPAVSYQTPKLISRLQPNQQQPPRGNHDSGNNSDAAAAAAAAASAAEKSPVSNDGSLSSSFYSQTKDGGHGSFMKYVPNMKSMYNKFRGKDILIAVMGYVIHSIQHLNGNHLTLRTA